MGPLDIFVKVTIRDCLIWDIAIAIIASILKFMTIPYFVLQIQPQDLDLVNRLFFNLKGYAKIYLQ